MTSTEIIRIDPIGRLAKVVVVKDMVYLSGLTARDKSGDVGAQTADILNQIEHYLAKAGTSKEGLIRVNIWLDDIAQFDAMNKVWDAWVDVDAQPARATVEAKLAAGGNLVEMMATAVI